MIEDTYYAEFTARNRGLISDRAQRALRRARILIAGCGSTGGAAVEPLVRLGVGGLVLAEPGPYELNNLNRQHASLTDIGRNKAEVAAERAHGINPFLQIEVHPSGVAASNVNALVSGCDLIVDGVDVTTPQGWRAKFNLHAEAAVRGCPLVSGYDMSGTQYVRFYDYRQCRLPLDGEITEEQLVGDTVWELLLRIIPREMVPVDLVADIRAHRGEPDYSVPQLIYTSMLFGVVVARYAVEVLSDQPVKETVVLDIHQLVRGENAILT